MIRLLAVVDDAPAAARSLSAMTDQEVVIAGRDPLACIGLQWPGPQPEPDGDALRRYDRMIQTVMEACTVLPFRFWSVAERPADMDGWLAERVDELSALMKWVAGRVELAVRAAVGVAKAPAGIGSGREYLEHARRRRLGHPALLEIHSTLADAAADARVLSLGESALSAAYLVDAGRAADFSRMVEEAAASRPEIGGRSVTGPWAPYSFVDLPDGVVRPGRWGRG